MSGDPKERWVGVVVVFHEAALANREKDIGTGLTLAAGSPTPVGPRMSLELNGGCSGRRPEKARFRSIVLRMKAILSTDPAR